MYKTPTKRKIPTSKHSPISASSRTHTSSSSSSSSPLSSDTIQHLANFIIRPPRATYNLSDLGPRHTLYQSTVINRQDFQLTNPFNQKLECSYYKPEENRYNNSSITPSTTEPFKLPVVLYCHGNGSCRLEGLIIAKEILGYGIGLLTMDMSGSGLSQGDWISLGVREWQDIKVGIEWLKKREDVGKVILWGHSMGAATALMVGGRIGKNGATDNAGGGIEGVKRRLRFSTAGNKTNDIEADDSGADSGNTGQEIGGGLYEMERASGKFDEDNRLERLNDDRGKQRSDTRRRRNLNSTYLTKRKIASSTPIEIDGLVLDSPYASFDKIAQTMVHEIPLPPGVPKKLVLSVGIRAVRKYVKEKAGFDIHDINPLDAAKKCELPVFILHGMRDKTISPDHSQLIYKHYKGKDKTLFLLQRDDHESIRPPNVYDDIFLFLQRIFRKDGCSDHSNFVQVVKARGNDAIIAGRYRDAIRLYSEALDAVLSSEMDRDTQRTGTTDPDFSSRSTHGEKFDGASPRMESRAERVRRRFSRTSRDHIFSRSSRDYLFGRLSRSSHSYRYGQGEYGNQGADKRMDHSARIDEKEGFRSGHTRGGLDHGKGSHRHARASSRDSKSPSVTASASTLSSALYEKHGQKLGRRRSKNHYHSRVSTRHRRVSNASFLSNSAMTPKPRSKLAIKRWFASLRRRRYSRKRRANLFDDQAVSGRRRTRELESIIPTERISSGSVLTEGTRRPRSVGASPTIIGDLSYRENMDESDKKSSSFDVSARNLTEKNRDMAVALFGNRSLAKGKVGEHEAALRDADSAIKLNPKWTRGYLRKANALKNLSRLDEALAVLSTGLEAEPSNKSLLDMQRKLDSLQAEKHNERKDDPRDFAAS